ncbi:MAG: hypothetical protein AYP45_06555 [Candidatus Brocadia carolinensis]|uniref:Uncharacterized protein n=1 Tax=Candidatus Brocadia carolinensis TaxID=1004156 RepID=A0A1V4AUQ3_9BACT|nr:MAG: hypothetical protein AYP45_06555 [Candidatus Brocadia caroliniensis]
MWLRDDTMIYFSLAIGLILIIFLSFAIYGLWVKYIHDKTIRGFLFPGTMAHELSHAFVCLITGTTITELNLFTTDSAGIKYDKPKIPVLFDFAIAAAPLFGCAFCIFFLSKMLGNPIHFDDAFPKEIHFTLKGFFDLLRHLLDTVWGTFNSFKKEFQIKDVRHILFLVTLIIFAISIAPHKQDIKYLVLGFTIIAIILFFLDKAGIHLLKYGWWKYFIQESWQLTTTIIAALTTLLSVTLIIMGFIKAYRLTFGQKGTKK